MIGALSGFGTVWFCPREIANILLLSKVKDEYYVTFDSNEGNKFLVHKSNGTYKAFKESEKDLYYHNIAAHNLSEHAEFNQIKTCHLP